MFLCWRCLIRTPAAYRRSNGGGIAMTISKAQQKAVNKYVKENYDRINVNMPKGKKEKIQEQAAVCGMSVNAYINAAIDEKLSRNNADID